VYSKVRREYNFFVDSENIFFCIFFAGGGVPSFLVHEVLHLVIIIILTNPVFGGVLIFERVYGICTLEQTENLVLVLSMQKELAQLKHF